MVWGPAPAPTKTTNDAGKIGHRQSILIVVKRLRGVLLFLVLLAVGLAVTWRPLLTAAGAFLIVEDPLEKADVILVLSGGRKDERVRQGAELYRQGYAPWVLLSGGEELEGIAVPDLLRQQAVRHGIPDSALLF